VNEPGKAYLKYVQGCVSREKEKGAVVTAAGIAGDGTVPCSDAIQRLIDKNPNRDCTEGIHFFESREQAINWGMANFGHLASL
jgi:hypothetical protein